MPRTVYFLLDNTITKGQLIGYNTPLHLHIIKHAGGTAGRKQDDFFYTQEECLKSIQGGN
jgi:hypothetical protein